MDETIVAYILGAWIIIQTVIRLTPTKKDDEIQSRFLRILSLLIEGTRKK